MAEPLLEVRELSIAFGGLRAVQNVSFRVPRGSLTALIGPNGAGKTTLFALVSGFLRPDHGQVFFDGRDITGHAAAPERARRHDAHLPDRAALRLADGAREHRRRRAPAHRRPRRRAGRGRSAWPSAWAWPASWTSPPPT